MTFLVLAATLVTATFLFSPTIEQIFGEYYPGIINISGDSLAIWSEVEYQSISGYTLFI